MCVQDECKFNKEIFMKVNKHIRIHIISNVNDLVNLTKKYSIISINTHHHGCDNVVMLYNEQYPKIKHIITNHGMWNDKSNYFKTKLHNLSECTKLYDISEKLQKINSEYYNFKTGFIPVSLPFEDFPSANMKFSNNSFVMTICSRCIPEKGWKELINVTINLDKQYPDVFHLLLLGSGEYYDDLFTLYGNIKNIHFIGYTSKVSSYIKLSDVLLIPSYFKGESTPLILMESLHFNVPVITTDIGDTRNMMYNSEQNDYAGSVIELTENKKLNDEAFMKEIIKYWKDKDYYKKKKQNINNVKEKFNFNNIVEKYYEILKVSKNQIKIFEHGVPKTGTTSLGYALKTLFNNHISFKHDLYLEYEKNGYKITDNLFNILNKFDTFDDGPWHNIDIEILFNLFPKSKFIFLERELEEWLISIEKHHSPVYDHSERFNDNKESFNKHYLNYDWITNRECQRTCWTNIYNSKFESFKKYSEMYPDQFLIMNIKNGWEPLCNFLNVDIPDKEFPHGNKTIDKNH